MYCSRWPTRSLTVAVLLLMAFCGCRRPGVARVTRIAILPVENLSGEPSLDWLGPAAQGVIASQLAPSPDVRAISASALRDAYASRSQQALHGYLTADKGRLRLSCVLEDLSRHTTLRTIVSTGAAGGGILSLADQIARALSGKVRPFPAGNPEVVRLMATATDEKDHERAAAADPDCGLVYIGWARWLTGRGRRQEALKVLGAAQSRRERIAPIERAEVAVMAATLSGDHAARLQGLAELAALTPSDAQPARTLGQLEFGAWRFEAALTWYRRAIAIDPDNSDLRNMMAYAQAYGGDLDAARASAADYSRLVPDDPNAPDSLGEIEFLDGNFAAAEKLFLTAHEMNAAWRESGPLLKAAHARVMTGDVAGADGLVGRYLELRKSVNDPLIPYRQAQWEFVTGRRRQAMERLQSFRAAASGDVAAHAAAQLAAWKRQTGDLTGARQMAIEALKQGTTPPTRSLAALVTFVTEPPASASEWAVRAEQAFSQPADNTIRRYALAYALLFEGHFREASVLLKQMLRQTLPSLAGDLRTLTAWALIESGQTEDARAIGNLYPVPEAQGERTFSALAMPRVLQVRARLLEQQGQKDQAARLRAVYEKLKGDIPDAR